MYNTAATYEENYRHGPDARFVAEGLFPKITFTGKAKYEFLGSPLDLPLGVAAGPLLNAAFVKVALNAGFCMPVYKTVRSQEWPSNNWPNVLAISTQDGSSLYAEQNNAVIAVELDEKTRFSRSLSISNSFGVPSQKPSIWRNDFLSLNSFLINQNKQVVLSFQGTRGELGNASANKNAFINDIIKVTEMVCDCLSLTNNLFIEMNLSCPNEVQAPLYKDILNALEVISVVHSILSKQKRKIQLIVKIGVLSEEDLQRFICESAGKISAISAINTVSANIRKPNGEIALGSGALSGGVCGSLILEQGLQMVSKIAKVREKLGFNKSDLGIIGVGGVMTAKHFLSYLAAGADIVHAATGMMWNLNLAAEIAESLNVPFIKKLEVLA